MMQVWQAALGQHWPMRADVFRRVIAAPLPSQKAESFVSVSGDRVTGFLMTQLNKMDTPSPRASICTMAVLPEWQRKGIGTGLHYAVLKRLKELVVRLRRGRGN